MNEKERYSRHIVLKEIGEKGQKKLLHTTVAIVGAGALGNVIANALCRAGVGKIKVVDRDFIELNNLQRQSLFEEQDIGKPKSLVTAEKLKKINSEIGIEAVVDDVNPINIEKLIKGANLVLDATDNLEIRFLLNDACVKYKIPWVYGGAIGTYGMSMNIIPGKTPCFRCILPHLPSHGGLPTCELVGVLNTVPVIIGSIEATEALKILTENYKDINKSLLLYDVWHQNFRIIKTRRNKKCKCCVKHEFEFLTSRAENIISSLSGTH